MTLYTVGQQLLLTINSPLPVSVEIKATLMVRDVIENDRNHLWEKFILLAGFMVYTAAGHQRAIKLFWLHVWGVVMPSMYGKGVKSRTRSQLTGS